MTTRRLIPLILLAACAAPTDPTKTLDEASSSPVVFHAGGNGQVRGVTLTVPSTGRTSSARADSFLGLYGSALGIDDPSAALREREVVRTDGDSSETVVYDGMQDGHTVYGSDYRVRVNEDGEVTYAGGSIVRDPNASLPDPAVTAEEAVEHASEELGRSLSFVDGELVVFNLGLFLGIETPSILTWMVNVRGLERWTTSKLFLDAQTGELVFRLPNFASVRNRSTYSFEGVALETATLDDAVQQLVEIGPPVPGTTEDATNVHQWAGEYYDYLSSKHGRDSLDGAGMALQSYVDADGLNNAVWMDDTNSTIFDSVFTGRSVVAHEYTHGLISHSAGLEYAFESGAMNESLADSFAVFLVEGRSWTIGHDTPYGLLRDFADPSSQGDPIHTSEQSRPGTLDRCSPGAPCFDPAETCLTGLCIDVSDGTDWAGVHTNSSITNHAIYLMSQGGTHATSDVTVEGIGIEKVAALAYRSLTGMLGATSRFVDYRFAMRASALEFIEDDELSMTYTDCGAVLNAFAAVGIGVIDTDNDCFADDIDNCPCTYNPEQNDDDCSGEESPTECVAECTRIETCDECMMNDACGYCDGSCRSSDDEEACGAQVFDTECEAVNCGASESCDDCLVVAGCSWCGGTCQAARLACTDEGGNLIEAPTSCVDCGSLSDCASCAGAVGCGWDGASCVDDAEGDLINAPDECEDPCAAAAANCLDCTNTPGCGWEGMSCVTIGGQPDLLTRPSECVDCSGFSDCLSCATNGFCAWCPGGGCENASLTMCEGAIHSAMGCTT